MVQPTFRCIAGVVLLILCATDLQAETPYPGKKDAFHGFDMYVDGGHKIVAPKKVAPGKPWVWRARFWGHEPQFDVAMLEKGFHVVYCDVADLYGNDEAVARWNAFYNKLTTQHRLGPKPILEGMSRGGLIIYRWAAANPDKVAAIYGDAPVMDFKSWPGPTKWQRCIARYGLTTETAKTYQGNPVDILEPIAKANIPIIHVVGDTDEVVPVAKNTSIAEERYKNLGGIFKVIHKAGVGHHPHSLKDPTPIVEFLEKHTSVMPATQRGSLANKTENVVLVTMDGLRWQELFSGADARLMSKDAGKVENPDELRTKYFREDATDRREALMPFFWSEVARNGQVFGSPARDSKVTVTNGRFFSYPGYNELLCGFGDPKITSNAKVNNKNVTVLEWLNQKPEYENRVAAFASWDVFPYIINVDRSGVYVNAGWQPLEHFQDEATLAAYNRIAEDLPKYWAGVRYDAFTFRGAIEYLKTRQPRVLYVALGETDDWAHAGRYDLYLEAAKQNDDFIRQLWSTAQSMDAYRGKTSLVITTDHGRGDGREGWKNHNATLPGSDQMWLAVLGPDTPAKGVRDQIELTQSQIPATVAKLLGEDFTSLRPEIAKPIGEIFE